MIIVVRSKSILIWKSHHRTGSPEELLEEEIILSGLALMDGTPCQPKSTSLRALLRGTLETSRLGNLSHVPLTNGFPVILLDRRSVAIPVKAV